MQCLLKFLFGVIFVVAFLSDANAFGGDVACMPSDATPGTGTVYLPTGCLTSTQKCYGTLSTGYANTCVNSCNSCNTGSTRTQKTGTLANQVDSCTFTYYDCVSDGTTCSTKSASTCSGTASSITGCSSSSEYCFGSTKVRTCDICRKNYTRKSRSVSVSGCNNTYTQYYCESGTLSTCDESTNCKSDILWSNVSGQPYQKKTTRRCALQMSGGSTCDEKTAYRCKSGYYGTDQDCTACPENAYSIVATTINPRGSYQNTINDCYKTSGSDITGDYVYVNSDGSTYQCKYNEN